MTIVSSDPETHQRHHLGGIMTPAYVFFERLSPSSKAPMCGEFANQPKFSGASSGVIDSTGIFQPSADAFRNEVGAGKTGGG
jgi:hypothetical protein